MCQAYGYAVELMKLFNKISDEYNRLYLEAGKSDLKQQDILHKIESNNFNAAQGYKLAKELKEVREKRRAFKNDFEIIRAIKNEFVDKYDNQLKKMFKTTTRMNKTLDCLNESKVYINRIDEKGDIVQCNNKKLLEIQNIVGKSTA